MARRQQNGKQRRRRRRKKKKISGRKKGDEQLVQALRRLKGMKPVQRCRALAKSNDKFIRRLCAALRRLRSTSAAKRLSAAKQRQVKQHRVILRRLVNPRLSIQKKRKLLGQRGGFLASLLAGLIPTVVSTIAGLFKR